MMYRGIIFSVCVFLFVTDHEINDSILFQTVTELIHTYSQKDKSVLCLVLGIMYLLRIKNVLALFGGREKERVFTMTFSLIFLFANCQCGQSFMALPG